MSKLKIVGCQQSIGNYQGYDYNNLKLYGMEEAREKIHGNSVRTDSIPILRVGNLLEHCKGNFSNLIGLDVDVYYDCHGKPERVIIDD